MTKLDSQPPAVATESSEQTASQTLSFNQIEPEQLTGKSKRKLNLPWPLSIYQSAVGKKWVMALTGIALLGFVLVHMIGNLHLYEGPTKTHEYAEALRDLGGDFIPRTWILWAMRGGLIAAFGLHIHAAVSLTRMSRAANVSYQSQRDFVVANYASRTMRWTGPIIGLFVLYHLADLTWGWTNSDFVRGDPYGNVADSLSNIPVAIIYIVANIALALHIYHGAWSMFQSLGINSDRYNHLRRRFAQGFAAIILIGNLSFPILTLANVIEGELPVVEDELTLVQDNLSSVENNLSSVEGSIEQIEQRLGQSADAINNLLQLLLLLLNPTGS